MTLPKRSLHPASGDDRRTFLRALELVAGIGVQLAQIRRAVVGQRMPLEPCPQVFDRIQVWRIGRQEGQLDMTAQPVQIFAHQFAAVRLQPVPDNQQWLFEVRLECLQEFDDLFFPDASLVQAEQAVVACQPGDNRNVIPVEVKLDDRRASPGSPSAHARRAFADPGFVDKNDYSAFPLGFFLSEGQVRRFHWRTASSSRSKARFSGFCTLKPSAPRIRQSWVVPNRTPYRRSMTTPTRLSVQRSVPKPCSVGLCSTARRTPSSCDSSSLAGLPREGTARSASMPPSSSKPFHVYTVCRATPTFSATSAGRLPASSILPARSRFFVASSNRFAMQTPFINVMKVITHGKRNGCHDLRKYQ